MCELRLRGDCWLWEANRVILRPNIFYGPEILRFDNFYSTVILDPYKFHFLSTLPYVEYPKSLFMNGFEYFLDLSWILMNIWKIYVPILRLWLRYLLLTPIWFNQLKLWISLLRGLRDHSNIEIILLHNIFYSKDTVWQHHI